MHKYYYLRPRAMHDRERNYLRLRASLIVDAAKRRNREMPQNREVIKGSLNNTPLPPLRPSVLLFTPPSLQED